MTESTGIHFEPARRLLRYGDGSRSQDVGVSTLVETVATSLTAFTGLLAALAALTQVTAATRQRRAVDFWQSRISSSNDEVDKFAFTVLQREDLSSLVANSWVRPRKSLIFHTYMGVTGVAVAAWAGFFISEPKDSIGFLGLGPLLSTIFAVLLSIAFLTDAYSAWFTLRIQRARARRHFLRGKEPISIVHPRGDSSTLWIITGDSRFSLGIFLLATATVSATLGFSHILLSDRESQLPLLVIASITCAMLTGLMGLEFSIIHISDLGPEMADLYPPHGDDARQKELDKRIQQEFEQASKRVQERRERRRKWFSSKHAPKP